MEEAKKTPLIRLSKRDAMDPKKVWAIRIGSILVALIIGLYFLGKRAEKRQAEQKEQMEAVKQTVSMLVIDKKKMKIKDAGLPSVVL